MLLPPLSAADGVPAGTLVENTATVSYALGGSSASIDTNTTAFVVAERLDVVVTLQSPPVDVEPGDVNRALLFRVTNTGNGNEIFDLSLDSALPGDDFDPVPAATPLYFDSDSSGDLSPGDLAYQPGVNEPLLAADSSVDVLLVNDIPSTALNGALGRSRLAATARTGSGVPGTGFPGAGDGGGIAVVGTSGASASETGDYRVSDVEIAFTKTQTVSDPDGGTEPVAGAVISYSITIEVLSPGTANSAVVRDPIPQYTSFVPGSITLNGAALSDAADGDAGEYDDSDPATVVVRLGDIAAGDGVQTVRFDVTID